MQPTKQQVITWSLHKWSFIKIAKKFGLTRQRIYQIYNSKDIEIVEKEERIVKRRIQAPEYFKARHGYYCRVCKDVFWSKSKSEDAICIKCGSSNILTL